MSIDIDKVIEACIRASFEGADHEVYGVCLATGKPEVEVGYKGREYPNWVFSCPGCPDLDLWAGDEYLLPDPDDPGESVRDWEQVESDYIKALLEEWEMGNPDDPEMEN
jgi:hypothetical protein